MTKRVIAVGLSIFIMGCQGVALAQSEVSVERGQYISIIGGCHDCHTEGYNQSGGKIDPAKAMKGNAQLAGPICRTFIEERVL